MIEGPWFWWAALWTLSKVTHGPWVQGVPAYCQSYPASPSAPNWHFILESKVFRSTNRATRQALTLRWHFVLESNVFMSTDLGLRAARRWLSKHRPRLCPTPSGWNLPSTPGTHERYLKSYILARIYEMLIWSVLECLFPLEKTYKTEIDMSEQR